MSQAIDTHTGLPVQSVTAAAVRLDRSASEQHEACAALRSECELLAKPTAVSRIRTPASTPRADPGPPQIPSLARRPRVLLVDDDPHLLRIALSRFERAGFHCDGVQTGHEACLRLRRGWDVVVADLDLGPGCTGISVLREAALHCPNAVLVAWSGQVPAGEALARHGRAAGAHASVAKGGSSVSDLIAAVRALLGPGLTPTSR